MIRTLTTLAIAAALPAHAADRALLVGIDSYPGLTSEAALSGAVADASAMRDALTTEFEFEASAITLLTNESATADAIITALIDNLVGQTTPGDRVVLYFAGLGATAPAPGNDGAQRVLLTHEAPSVLGQVPADAITDILALIADRRITVLTDVSFSGAPGSELSNARGIEIGDPQGDLPAEPFASSEKWSTWTAAAPGQPAWETGDRGVFTKAFLDGLTTGAADANGNGTITNAELLTFTRARAAEFCEISADCAAAGGTLLPDLSGPVEAEPIGQAAAEPEPEKLPDGPTLKPPSGKDDKSIGYTETLGFVTDLFLPSNEANLTLAVQGGPDMTIGDTIAFEAKADAPGTLVLLDVNPNGELAQIYPSSLNDAASTRMTAGETLTVPSGLSTNGLPMRLRVTEPAGQGFLLALFVEDDLPTLTAILPENLSGGPIPNAGQYLYGIAQDLLRLQVGENGATPIRWSATYLPYTIDPS